MMHRDNTWRERLDTLVRDRFGRVQGWLATHHVTRTLIIVGLVASVGYWRLQQVQDQDAQHFQQAIMAVKAQGEKESADNAQRIAVEQAIIVALKDEVNCVEAWASATTTRSKVLTPYSNARIAYLFAAFRAAQAGNTGQALRLFDKANKENDAFLRTARKYKIPVPSLNCSTVNIPTGSPSAPSKPTPSKAKTVYRTTPGPTVYITVVSVPPPVTVTAPPGKGHRR